VPVVFAEMLNATSLMVIMLLITDENCVKAPLLLYTAI
jgi:hypothetical protein